MSAEALAAQLRAEISALFDERRQLVEDTRRKEAVATASAVASSDRERRALETASQRAEELAKAAKAALIAQRGAAGAGAAAAAQMHVELMVLREEERVRQTRIGTLEKDINTTQTKIAAQAVAYEGVLRHIADVKTDLAAKEVCCLPSPCALAGRMVDMYISFEPINPEPL